MNFTDKVKKSFDYAADHLFQDLKSGEELVLNLDAEDSLFVRFNKSRVRQNTQVEQITLSMQIQSEGRTTKISFNLTGDAEVDLQRSRQYLQIARHECAQLPVDAYQIPLKNNGISDTRFTGQLLPSEDSIEAIVGAAQDVDLAGLYCAGPVITANRNSKGQSHWFSTENFFVDYSLYNGEKAVKAVYAGTKWKQADFARTLADAKNQLALMDRPKKKITPGNYRVYLAPGAVSEVLSLFGWGGLSYGDYRRGHSSFKKLGDGEKQFSPKFTLSENFALGLTPRFNSLGELAPECLELIHQGRLKTFLISSRSAQEFKVEGNQAGEGEIPRSLEMAPGTLKRDQILKELGTGLYLSNLHYLNWSDRQNARITGMTRYACFWVENGEIVAPIADLRFDESLYDCLGDQLLAVTDFQEIDPQTGTYSARSLGGRKVPGLLVQSFKFTL